MTKANKQYMSTGSFTRNLRRGLGSAIMELNKNPEREEYRDIVMRSCLIDIAYDTQVEGTKGYFLYTAIKTFSNPEMFLERIMEKFGERLYWRLSEQLYDLLCCFSNDGHDSANEAFEKKYYELKNHLPLMRDNEIIRFSERELFEKLMIKKLDTDFEAFKQCTNDMGEMIIRRGNDDCLWYDFFMEISEEKFGSEIFTFLETTDNNNIKVFFQMYKKSRTEESYDLSFKIMTVNDFSKAFRFKHDEVEEKLTIEQLLSRAKELSLKATPNPFQVRPISRKFAGQATEEELKELARILIDEPTDFIKAALLHVFNFVDFPLDVGLILPYLTSTNDCLREIVLRTLSLIKDKRIHDCAIQLLNDAQVEDATVLLEANFEIEDEALIRKHILRSKRVGHGTVMNITNIYEKNESTTCGDILLHLYKNAECTHCRYNVVEAMINNAVIPKNILIECQYDSFEDTRLLAAEFLKKNTKPPTGKED